MPFREKLKKVLHLDDNEPSGRTSQDAQSLTDVSIRSTRYSDVRQGEFPRSGQRPLSGDKKSPISPSRNHDALGSGRSVPASPTAPLRAIPQSPSTKTNVRRSEDVMTHARVPDQPHTDRYSEKVADSNMIQNDSLHNHESADASISESRPDSLPPQLGLDLGEHYDGAQISSQMANGNSTLSDRHTRGESISRKAVGSTNATSHQLNRKPSSTDLTERAKDDGIATSPKPITSDRDMKASAANMSNNTSQVVDGPPSLEGIVDLSNTIDTSVNEKWAPAVTHEVVNRHFHHIREELITREIHNHHVYHRILPIIDVEVLPARHFVPDGKGGRIEITEDEIPGRTGPYQKTWAIVENVSKGGHIIPRQFTARQFHGTDGDYKEYISAAGVPTTETTWVHPPTIEELGEYTGQTVPFHFGSENPKDDGLRVYAPTGPVTGSSRMHAEHHQQLSSLPTEELGKMSLNEDVSTTDSPQKLKAPTRFL